METNAQSCYTADHAIYKNYTERSNQLLDGRRASVATPKFRHNAAAARCIGARDFAGAIDHYRRILEVAPNDPFAPLMLVQCHSWNGDTQAAFDAAKRLEATEPSDFFSLRALACAYAKHGEHHSAKPYIERALVLADGAARLGLAGTVTLWFDDIIVFLKSWLFGFRHLIDKRRQVDQYNDSIRDWKRWAEEYLSWYAATYGSGSNALP